MPFNVVLVAPEIPQNTGNIIRLCANTGARLHLVEPIAFDLTEKSLRRASLDYRDLVDVTVHSSFESLFGSIDVTRTFGALASGKKQYDEVEFRDEDTIVFGSESQGLSSNVASAIDPDNHIHLPMMPANRSLNLSNAVAVVVYEMWRQQAFAGSATRQPQSGEYFS